MEIDIYKLSTCVYSTENAIFAITDKGSVEDGHRSVGAGNQTIVAATDAAGTTGVLFNLCKNRVNFTYVETADPSFNIDPDILKKCGEAS